MVRLLWTIITWVTLGAAVDPDRPLEVVAISELTSSGENTKPCVVGRPQGGAYVAWARKEGERTAVLFAALDDGERFIEPIVLSTDGMDLDLGAENGPSVAVDRHGTIYVVWSAGSWAASAAKHPAATKPAVTGAESPASAADATRHAGHGHQHRKGAPARPGNLNIYLARSSDHGRTFCRPIRINDDPDGPEHRFPAVTTDDAGNVFVAWLDKRPSSPGAQACRVFVSVSRDQGLTFSPNVDATAGQDNPICHCCRLAVVANSTASLLVAFRNDVDDVRDIFLVQAKDLTKPFSKPVPIEDTAWFVPMCPMNGPSIVWDETAHLHTAWVTGGDVDAQPAVGGESSAGYKILYRRFQLESHQSEPPLYVADGEHPRLVIHRTGSAILAWDARGIVSIAAITPDATRASALALSASGSFPTVATDASGETIWVAWQERDGDGRQQVKLARVALQLRSGN